MEFSDALRRAKPYLASGLAALSFVGCGDEFPTQPSKPAKIVGHVQDTHQNIRHITCISWKKICAEETKYYLLLEQCNKHQDRLDQYDFPVNEEGCVIAGAEVGEEYFVEHHDGQYIKLNDAEIVGDTQIPIRQLQTE